MSGKHLAIDARSAQNDEIKEGVAVIREENGRTAKRMRAVGVLTLLLMVAVAFLPTPVKAAGNAGGQVSVGVSVSFGPPPLPVYAQPMCPGPGYIWTPGYWGYDRDDGYYWVPGTWVAAPFPGALWTPGYWGWDPAVALFEWHRGYWGLTVGFYGGIDYGFGYPGRGYFGGYWDHDVFFYNRVYSRLDPRFIRHFYDRDDHDRWRDDDGWGDRGEHRGWDQRRVSYNGGRGGIDLRPTWREREAERDRRMGPIREQERHQRYARRMPAERWSVNHGRPDIAATRRPERFMGRDVVRATRAGGPYRMDPNRRDHAQRQNGWHTFGGGRGDRNQPAQNGYRDTRGRNNQPRQFDGGRQQMRPMDGQRSSGQRGSGQPNYRNAQRQDSQRRQNGGWQQMRQPQQQRRQEMRSQPQQRGGGGYSQRSGGNWQRVQQRRDGGARPAQNRGGNAGRQPRQNDKQNKRDNPHQRGGHRR